MRVVHERAGAAGLELVHKGLAHRDGWLVQPAHTVHAVGQALAVPVDGGVLGQAVGDEDAHAVAFHHLNGGAGALAVVAPHVDQKARRHLAHHGLGHQVEFLHAGVHAPGGRPAVERDHRVVRAARGGLQRRRGVGAGLDDGFGQRGQGHAADGGSGHGGGSARKEVAAVHVSDLVGWWRLRRQMPNLARRRAMCR